MLPNPLQQRFRRIYTIISPRACVAALYFQVLFFRIVFSVQDRGYSRLQSSRYCAIASAEILTCSPTLCDCSFPEAINRWTLRWLTPKRSDAVFKLKSIIFIVFDRYRPLIKTDTSNWYDIIVAVCRITLRFDDMLSFLDATLIGMV